MEPNKETTPLWAQWLGAVVATLVAGFFGYNIMFIPHGRTGRLIPIPVHRPIPGRFSPTLRPNSLESVRHTPYLRGPTTRFTPRPQSDPVPVLQPTPSITPHPGLPNGWTDAEYKEAISLIGREPLSVKDQNAIKEAKDRSAVMAYLQQRRLGIDMLDAMLAGVPIGEREKTILDKLPKDDAVVYLGLRYLVMQSDQLQAPAKPKKPPGVDPQTNLDRVLIFANWLLVRDDALNPVEVDELDKMGTDDVAVYLRLKKRRIEFDRLRQERNESVSYNLPETFLSLGCLEIAVLTNLLETRKAEIEPEIRKEQPGFSIPPGWTFGEYLVLDEYMATCNLSEAEIAEADRLATPIETIAYVRKRWLAQTYALIQEITPRPSN